MLTHKYGETLTLIIEAIKKDDGSRVSGLQNVRFTIEQPDGTLVSLPGNDNLMTEDVNFSGVYKKTVTTGGSNKLTIVGKHIIDIDFGSADVLNVLDSIYVGKEIKPKLALSLSTGGEIIKVISWLDTDGIIYQDAINSTIFFTNEAGNTIAQLQDVTSSSGLFSGSLQPNPFTLGDVYTGDITIFDGDGRYWKARKTIVYTRS